MSATYRLQLRGPGDNPAEAFTFSDATTRVPYLARLGVTHLYLSPIMTAPKESTHGYDVTNPTEINPELGGMEGFKQLAEAARDAGLKILIDIVPNHVGVDTPKLNPWWWDVLAKGKDSEFVEYFDIDFSPQNGAEGRIGLPMLGSPNDVSALEVDGDELVYYDHRFPIAEGTNHGTPQEIHDLQHYKLMFWRDGIISYRRFFSINGLAGIRQEDPVVFEHWHRVLNQLLAADLVDGVRVDHPDGLANPFQYLKKLRKLIGKERWLLVEKILGVDEPLDPRLTVDGTTGYDALREFDGVFVHRPAETILGDLAEEHTGKRWDARDFEEAETQQKKVAATDELAAEIRRLAAAVRTDNWSTAGESVYDEELQEVLVELIAAMPVYRADYESLSRVTSTVIAEKMMQRPEWQDALDLIATALISRSEANTRFAQVCGAVMAKGVEDTAFYRGSRLVSLQEVGGAPGRFGVSPAEFHLLQAERARLWPRAMTTLTTHDTKRGEDVRSRITTLTEFPEEFAQLVAKIPYVDGVTCHFLLQNIIGVWPAEGDVTDELRNRVHDYAMKAMREAGLHTTWYDVNEEFEASIHDWIDDVCENHASELAEFVAMVDEASVSIANGKKVLQLLAPGIPDVYQGTEVLTDHLVDPDNRRAVNFDALEEALERVSRGDIRTRDDERMHLVTTALRVRKQCELDGAKYLPVMATGPYERHMLGMLRGDDVMVLVTRRPRTVPDWEDTTVTLPEGMWEEQLGGGMFEGTVKLATLFKHRPQAILTRAGS
ncbi:malto-oligosyltrehalose synthase [uncultured Corynebacterium sp.]|uniref:malto-oligosyltrehalose synthase n=1 Tax=uncultured Corynebacterium sp. TaxID=159447 RepID=UPI0025F6DAFF|nr:malto-oligosyltrehalose synthase [uncultured Corynebacterium sp.]